ncbi:hypothetical protein AMECASPLE_027978, partial [Ameca splendens]
EDAPQPHLLQVSQEVGDPLTGGGTVSWVLGNQVRESQFIHFVGKESHISDGDGWDDECTSSLFVTLNTGAGPMFPPCLASMEYQVARWDAAQQSCQELAADPWCKEHMLLKKGKKTKLSTKWSAP